jgi:hypothetical protein
VLWHLAYDYADITLRSSAFIDWRPQPGEKPRMMIVRNPEVTALGCANMCIMTHLHLPKPGMDLFDWQFAIATPAERHWPLPPYPFGVNGQRV